MLGCKLILLFAPYMLFHLNIQIITALQHLCSDVTRMSSAGCTAVEGAFITCSDIA